MSPTQGPVNNFLHNNLTTDMSSAKKDRKDILKDEIPPKIFTEMNKRQLILLYL